MKRLPFSLIVLLLAASRFLAQANPPSDVPKADTNWPGVEYQVVQVQRIPDDRLLLVINIQAGAQAPAMGTLIGTQVPVPKDATPVMIAAGLYRPTPFSLETATLTDDATRQEYASLKPRPGGPQYIPGSVLMTLHPNQGVTVTLQFSVPPPPKSADGPRAAVQTVSLKLPNAKKTITGIALPPASPAQ